MVLITALRVSQPWSISSPRVDELPVFRACFPSQLSKIWSTNAVHNKSDSEEYVNPAGNGAIDSEAEHKQKHEVRDHD